MLRLFIAVLNKYQLQNILNEYKLQNINFQIKKKHIKLMNYGSFRRVIENRALDYEILFLLCLAFIQSSIISKVSIYH